MIPKTRIAFGDGESISMGDGVVINSEGFAEKAGSGVVPAGSVIGIEGHTVTIVLSSEVVLPQGVVVPSGVQVFAKAQDISPVPSVDPVDPIEPLPGDGSVGRVWATVFEEDA